MGYDCAIQVIEHRTFLQPQGLYHGQHPLHEPTPRRAVATKGILRHSTPKRRMRSTWLFVGSTPSIDANNHNAGYSAKRLAQKVAALESAQEQPCSKTPWSSRAIGSNRACSPVGPVRRGGTPTSRRTGIPRHPDPPGQLLQRVLLDRPASESRVSGGPNRFAQVQRQLVVDRPAVATDDAGDRLTQQGLKAREISPEVNHEKGHCRGRRVQSQRLSPFSFNWSRPCSSPGPHGPPPEPLDRDWPRQHSSPLPARRPSPGRSAPRRPSRRSLPHPVGRCDDGRSSKTSPRPSVAR